MSHHDRHALRLRSDVGQMHGPEQADFALSTWQGQIPVPAVDIALSLFGATAPAELLPETPPAAGFFEPLGGLAMREMFETAIFANFSDQRARPESLTVWRRR